MSRGRPSKYDEKNNKQVVKLCKLGATDKELAEFFEVSLATVTNWKKDFPDFLVSIKKGKIEADANVSKRLYKRACGYKFTETTKERIFNKETKEYELVITKVVKKKQPPETAAAIYWLNNRRKNWSNAGYLGGEGGTGSEDLTFEGWD